MPSSTVNVLLTSFPGLGLPPTVCTPVSSSISISKLAEKISELLPPSLRGRLLLTTVSGKSVDPSSHSSISTLQSTCLAAKSDILQLRLSVPLCGGKGGFGSQLRAAGGRMSSRKKRAQGENNGSNRNLDGRRLRTVTEAKALAEYLAVKPEMDKKEKEERRKRWQQVVEASEAREEEIRSGKGTGKGKIDAKWLEEKEEAESRTREAIAAAMKEGLLRDDVSKIRQVDEDGEGDNEIDTDEDAEDDGGSSSKATTPSSTGESSKDAPRKIFGWDEDEDDPSDSGDDEDE